MSLDADLYKKIKKKVKGKRSLDNHLSGVI